MKLSIIIPAYNEERTILTILDKVAKSKISIDKEIIVVNDGSKDSTVYLVRDFIKKNKNLDVKLFEKTNGGKGSAVRHGVKNSTGEIILIQDADLEYDPNDYESLINPIINGECKVVYGSRRLKKDNKKHSAVSFYLGGMLVTFITNLLYGSRLTDEPTCYKVFQAENLKRFELKGNKFDWEPEITGKMLRKGIKIKEVPISYYPRSKKEGKKINWRDGIHAIYTLFYWRIKS